MRVNAIKNPSCTECLVSVTVNNCKVIALIDSGATHCMIGKSMISQVPELQNEIQQLDPEITATAVNGSNVRYTGSIDLIVNIQGNNYPVYALYLPHISYDIILGFDFLKHHNLVIDFADMAVNTKRSCGVRLSESVTLEPDTETLLWGTPDTDIMFGTGLVKNTSGLPKTFLFVANVVVSVTPYQKHVPVQILNPSLEKRFVEKDTVIANPCLVPQDASQINADVDTVSS